MDLVFTFLYQLSSLHYLSILGVYQAHSGMQKYYFVKSRSSTRAYIRVITIASTSGISYVDEMAVVVAEVAKVAIEVLEVMIGAKMIAVATVKTGMGVKKVSSSNSSSMGVITSGLGAPSRKKVG